MSQPKIPSGYWFAHFILVIGLPIALIFAWAGILLNIDILFWVYMIMIWPILGAGLAAIYGYHKEANQLKEIDAEWIPHKWFYTVGHLFLGGWPVAAIYLVQRWRHIGIPWGDIPFYNN